MTAAPGPPPPRRPRGGGAARALAALARAVPPVLRAAAARLTATAAAVLAVFVLLYYVAVACVIAPWLSFTVPGVLHGALLTATTSAGLACYVICMGTDPGTVPPGWAPDSEASAAVQEVKKSDGAPRFCKKCQRYKPPRAHHCRVCERCVLRMDHHCPWVANCIGHANYRAFFLLLVYCSAALLHTTGLLAAHALHIMRSNAEDRVVRVGPQATPHELAGGDASGHVLLHTGLEVLAALLALPTTIAVVSLLAWHVRMVAANKTTIEHAEGVTAQIKAGGLAADRLRHPYDLRPQLGPCANAADVFGPDPLAWLLPSCAPTPGGLAYRTAFDGDGGLGF
ncbi:PAT16 [Scenedesmus sp. PABB004]|nr:PAT16 [Scenedesmus sp. PABB004]